MLEAPPVPRPSRLMDSSDRPGRTFITPADECTNILRSNMNEGEEFTQANIRAISLAVSKITEYGFMSSVDTDVVRQYLKLQDSILEKSEVDFPYDVIDISLKMLASDGMARELYNEDWIKRIVRSLYDLCMTKLFTSPDDNGQLNRIAPIFRQLAHLLLNCRLSDVHLHSLAVIGVAAFYLQMASPSLQAAACSLLVSLWKISNDESYRMELLGDIFDMIKKKAGNPKKIGFEKNKLKTISCSSWLILEIAQTKCEYPMDGDDYVKKFTGSIVQLFFTNFTIIQQQFEQFVEDIDKLIVHPHFPVAPYFLNQLITISFHLIKKSQEKGSPIPASQIRLAIKVLAQSLCTILRVIKESEEITRIQIPPDLIDQIGGYSDEMIAELVHSEGTHFIFEEENNFLQIDQDFPKNGFEKLTVQLIICLYINQNTKLSDLINTSLPFWVSLWSLEEKSDQDSINYSAWWRKNLPNSISFEWTFEICKIIISAFLSKTSIFVANRCLIQRFLRYLNDKNSQRKSWMLKGFALLLKVEPEILYHPLLVSAIQPAFVDPSPAIREAVLDIVGTYITQKSQMESPYFPIVVRCLNDSSNTVVRKALNVVKNLSSSANDEQLYILCQYLLPKVVSNTLSDRAMSNLAISVLVQTLFDDAKKPAEIMIRLMPSTDEKTEWFGKIFKSNRIKYHAEAKVIINDLISIISNEVTYKNVSLLREFSCFVPKLIAPYHEQLISSFSTCSDKPTKSVFLYLLSNIIQDITCPSISQFKILLTNKLRDEIICTDLSSALIRPAIILCTKIIENIIPDSPILEDLVASCFHLLQTKRNSTDSIDQICRTMLILGCIYRYRGAENEKKIGQSYFGIIGTYFKNPSQKIKAQVLTTACDLCARCTSLTNPGCRNLLRASFKGNPPLSFEAVDFLHRLIKLESSDESKKDLAIDQSQINYSNNLLQEFESDIQLCFNSSDPKLRAAVLSLTRTALSYGIVPPHNYLPFIFSMTCFDQHKEEALVTLKEVAYNHEDALCSRFIEGMKKAYSVVISQYPNGLISLVQDNKLSSNQQIFKVCEFYPILSENAQKRFLNSMINIFCAILDEANDIDNDWAIWLVYVIANIPFAKSWEPAFIINEITKGKLNPSIVTHYENLKSFLISKSQKNQIPNDFSFVKSHFSYLLCRLCNHFCLKYVIRIKKLNNYLSLKKKSKAVRINPDQSEFKSIVFNPVPDDKLVDTHTNLFGQYQSIRRMMRKYENLNPGTNQE